LVDGTLDHCNKMVTQVEIATKGYIIKRNIYIENIENDVILGTPWINSLGHLIIDGTNLEICLKHEGNDVILRGMIDVSAKVVSCNKMERILKHDQAKMIAQCLIMDNNPTKEKIFHLEIQPMLEKYKKVFGDIPPGLPPKRGFEHSIESEEGAKPIITTPYRHPHKYKEEKEKTIKELLDMGHIQPSSSPSASSVVLVKKKDKTMRMCIDY